MIGRGRSPFLLSTHNNVIQSILLSSVTNIPTTSASLGISTDIGGLSFFPSTSIRVAAGERGCCGLALARVVAGRSCSFNYSSDSPQTARSFIAISISRRYVSYLPNKCTYFLPPHGHNLATRAFGHELLSKLLLFFFSGKGDKYLMRLI